MRLSSLIRSAAVTSAASLVSMLLGAVTAKLIAIFAGPSGIAIFSQLRQAGQFMTLCATLNGQNSLIRGIAAGEGDAKNSFAFSIGAVYVLGVILICSVFLPLAPWISSLLFPSGEGQLSDSIYLLLPLACLGAMAAYYQAVLNGLRQIRALAFSQIGAALAAVLSAYPCVKSGDPIGYMIIVGVGFVASIILSTSALRKIGWKAGGFLPVPLNRKSIETSALRDHLPLAVVGFVTGISGAAMVIGIRTLYIHEGGLQLGGIFDAAWTISMMYVMLLLSAFGAHYLPLLSGARNQEEIRSSVVMVFRVSTLLSIPLICTAIVFKPTLTSILYSKEFSSATELLRWTMLGDYLKISSWIFGMLLIARSEKRIFILSELAWQSIFLGTVALFIEATHEIAGIAYVAVNAFYLLFVWRHARRSYGVNIEKRIFREWLAGFGLVLLFTLLAWEDRDKFNEAVIVFYLVILPVFFFAVTSPDQRAKIFAYIQARAYLQRSAPPRK